MSVDMKDYLAYQEGYEAGKRDAASPWHRVEEPPKENGAYAVCWKSSNSWGKLFYCGEWLDTPRTQFPDYWMPIEPPKEENNGSSRKEASSDL